MKPVPRLKTSRALLQGGGARGRAIRDEARPVLGTKLVRHPRRSMTVAQRLAPVRLLVWTECGIVKFHSIVVLPLVFRLMPSRPQSVNTVDRCSALQRRPPSASVTVAPMIAPAANTSNGMKSPLPTVR